MRKILVLLALTLVVGGAALAQDAGERPFLGITFSAEGDGALVRAVLADSPAAAAGLQVDDLILALNGAELAPADFVETVAALAVGNEITLTILRDGAEMKLAVTLGSAPARRSQWQGFRDGAFLGVSLVIDEAGVLVEDVVPESPAEAAGLQAGDLLRSINDEEVETPLAAADIIRALEPGAVISLGIERQGETLMLEAVAGSRSGITGSLPEGMLEQLEQRFRFRPNAGQPLLGVEYLDLDAQVAAERELTRDEGALILRVLPESPAEAAGLLAEDIIVGVAGDPVDARRTLRERLLAYDPGETLQLDLQRAGEPLQLEVTLAQHACLLPSCAMLQSMPEGGEMDLEALQALRERLGRGLEQFDLSQPEAMAPAPDV